jgi:hypothetical protein
MEGLGARQRVMNFFRAALFKDGVNRSCASTLTSISAVMHSTVKL